MNLDSWWPGKTQSLKEVLFSKFFTFYFRLYKFLKGKEQNSIRQTVLTTIYAFRQQIGGHTFTDLRGCPLLGTFSEHFSEYVFFPRPPPVREHFVNIHFLSRSNILRISFLSELGHVTYLLLPMRWHMWGS